VRLTCEAPGRWGLGVGTRLVPVPHTLIRRAPGAAPNPAPPQRIIPHSLEQIRDSCVVAFNAWLCFDEGTQARAGLKAPMK